MRNALVAAALAASAFVGAAAGSALAQTAPTPPARGMGMTRADANGDGVVTRAEAVAQADAQFDAMDANHDGKVTGDEMRAAFEARGGGTGRMGGRFGGGAGGDMTREDFRTRALARFDRNDTNHDGRVDQAEMAAARQMRMDRRGDGAGTPAPATPQQ